MSTPCKRQRNRSCQDWHWRDYLLLRSNLSAAELNQEDGELELSLKVFIMSYISRKVCEWFITFKLFGWLQHFSTKPWNIITIITDFTRRHMCFSCSNFIYFEKQTCYTGLFGKHQRMLYSSCFASANGFVPTFLQLNNEQVPAHTEASADLSGSICLSYKLHAVRHWKQACAVVLTPGWNTRYSKTHCCTACGLISWALTSTINIHLSNKGSGVGAKTSADLKGFCSPPKDTSSLISWQLQKLKDCLKLLNQWNRSPVSAGFALPRDLGHVTWSGVQEGML